MKYINEFIAGDKFEGDLLITNVSKNIANNGSPYLGFTMQDKTGSIDAKKWEVSEDDIAISQIGMVIHVIGDIIDYRGALQLRISSLKAILQESIDYNRFCLESPIPQQELERKLKHYIESIQNEDCKEIIKRIMKRHYNEFVIFPAASKNHHEFASGLLYHTVSMLDLASAIQNLYQEINRDLLLTGAILHDVGKTIELSGPIATKYTTEGRLLGHITLSVSELRLVCEEANIHSEVPLLLEHMILSHHGEQEFGSPIPPLTLEAFALHAIDDFDAKITMIDKALEATKEGEFSLRILSLDNRAFYKPKKL